MLGRDCWHPVHDLIWVNAFDRRCRGVGRKQRSVESHRPPLHEGRVSSHGVALSFSYAWRCIPIQSHKTW